MRWLVVLLGCCLAGCGGSGGNADRAVAPRPVAERGAALAAARAGRCVVCHAADAPTAAALQPPLPLPLPAALPFHCGPALTALLQAHFGGDDAAVLAAFVRDLTGDPPLAPSIVGVGALLRGERLWRAFACAACHPQHGVEGLAARTDHAHLSHFLQAPGERRPDLAHDFALGSDEAHALAAWLLRDQRVSDPTAAASSPDAAPPGLGFECFELQVESADLPDLDALVPAARGNSEHVDVSVRTRDDHFALRFTGYLIVPTTGEWTLTLGSDDCSWLWIDGELLVENAELAPHRRRHGTVMLDAGAHALCVVFTEAAGEQSLEMLWAGPGVEQAEVPPSALTGQVTTLQPTASVPAQRDDHAIARGRRAFAARRCGACHVLDGAPPPGDVPAAAPWSELAAGQCPTRTDAAAVAGAVREALAASDRAPVEVEAALAQHGCRACHVRDGRGGVAAAVRSALVEREDLGDEGRVPPDLTRVGRRLRPGWLEATLRGDERARPYMLARMPRLPADLARSLAQAFAAVDGRPDDDVEPEFTIERVERGRDLAGTGGKNCAVCHPFGERRALGAQGMDLAVQYERLQPRWFRDWLLHAAVLRPGTRMPTLWPPGGAAGTAAETAGDIADADALRVWSSLGRAAPVPAGYATPGEALVLDPIDRPILHGAFLDGLSARCLAVGTPLRGHFAYDLEHCRLAWLWRGAFLDAAGTWRGRAGKLLRPLDDDHVLLDDLPLVALGSDRPGGDVAARRCIGQRRDAAGYPMLRIAVGDPVSGAEVEDSVLPRLTAAGAEFVRTLRCVRGAVRIGLTAGSGGARVFVDGEPAAARELHAGSTLEVVYRW